ncbi:MULTISPECIES: vWA domain-containing protein [Hyphomonas]|jgi:hypothetical protein|uniref:vWA domain-containing protein n=1 Tax=Hyphomonas TaxID=85 RepID=UPI00351568C3
MERQITSFIRALRASDVRVSTGEAIDATRAVSVAGYSDRAFLKDALRCTLAKSPEEAVTFDELFDAYFAPRSLNSSSQDQDNQNSEQSDASSEIDPVDLMESGDEAAIASALERAANAVDADDIRFSTQIAYYAQQMVREMGGERIQERLMQAFQQRSEEGDTEAERLIELRRDLTMRARERVQRSYDIFGKGETEQFRNEFAENKKLSAIELSDMARMKVLVARIAKRLAVKHSRRRRKKNRGQLDARRTMRANAGVDGVPFNVVWRQKRREKPKIVVICDVSGSVARYVRFLLLLLWSMKDVVPDLHAFAFSNKLVDVDDILEKNKFEDAMDQILRVAGMGSTDYGEAWTNLKSGHEQLIDRRTTIIVLGDGRSNHGNPRTDLFRSFAARAKRTIWLNPEPQPAWGTGDSEIPRYRPYCSSMSQVSTLKDLERAVDDVLNAYA